MAYVSIHIFDAEDGICYAVETDDPVDGKTEEEVWENATGCHKGACASLAQLHQFCEQHNMALYRIDAPRDPVHARDLQMRLILNAFNADTTD